jgi:hypothetical protein
MVGLRREKSLLIFFLGYLAAIFLLMRNRAVNFSVGRLMEFLTALRQDVQITVRPSRTPHGLPLRPLRLTLPHPTVISNGAGRRLFFHVRSCERVGPA